MLILHSALGYLTLLSIAWLVGRRTRTIPWKTLGAATLLQLLLKLFHGHLVLCL